MYWKVRPISTHVYEPLQNVFIFLIVVFYFGRNYVKATLNFSGFEVFMPVTMKNGLFWGVVLCGSCKNQHFGGTCPPSSGYKKSVGEERH
jgi:hypothetical protein